MATLPVTTTQPMARAAHREGQLIRNIAVSVVREGSWFASTSP